MCFVMPSEVEASRDFRPCMFPATSMSKSTLGAGERLHEQRRTR